MNWVNYDDALAQLRASGLQVEAILAAEIGTRRRVRVEGDKEKRGWYHLHELQTDRGSLLVGSFGVWRGNDQGTTKISLRGVTLTSEQQQSLRDRIQDDQRREQARRRAEGDRAAKQASDIWLRLATTGQCDYLDRKQVKSHGLRFSKRGALAIPMLDASGVIHGLQLIYPKGHASAKRLGRDKDFFPRGVIKQGHFYLIGAAMASTVIGIAEGYATAASVHEATGLPVAVAFDAGNLLHVAKALAARYRDAKLLILADDDYLAKCRACGQLTSSAETRCEHCGEDHKGGNAGFIGAQAASLAVSGSVCSPWFPWERPRDAKGPTDWNDLHVLSNADGRDGLRVVEGQVSAHLSAIGWRPAADSAASPPQHGGGEDSGEGGNGDLYVVTAVGQLSERFALVYEMTETVFDAHEHKLVPLSSMRNLCSSRQLHRAWMESYDKRILRVAEVGFDPTEKDLAVKGNLWGGWPTTPAAGDCSKLLELGEYLCSDDARSRDLWQWMLCWLAYPIQHPGGKLKTALVLHGPQGTGKNLFFEAYMRIFGEYGRVIDQEAIEDKFNDSLSRKLFLVADEVVARQELFHTKNKLKGLVTGTQIRINPKNVGAYFETNHLNLVFLSNEPMPMVLERDDRRYCIIWTPPKLDPDFYNAVLAEIEAGGIAALHSHLLQVDLSGFGPATLPPETEAKRELIELSLDSSERMYNEWLRRELPLPISPVRTEDLYAAYRHWCTTQGVNKPAQLSTVIGALGKRPGVRKSRVRHFKQHSRTITAQSMVLWPPGTDQELDMTELSTALATFGDAVTRYREPAKPGRDGGAGGPAPGGPDEEGF